MARNMKWTPSLWRSRSRAVPRRVQWMGKKQLFVFPFRRFFRIIGTFPVDREGGGRAAIRAALAFLAEGWALGIFPEGTHRGDEGAKQAKSGVVVLALRSGASVLPVHVGKLPGPLSRLRGQRLHIFVGEPVHLDPAMRGGAAYREAADERGGNRSRRPLAMGRIKTARSGLRPRARRLSMRPASGRP